MDKIYLGNKLENFESSEPFLPISRVILKVDSQNGYIAGDESGRTIEKTMPWATQAMADSILASLKGQVYKPYSGSGALLDPAAELGDALTVAGNYGILAGMSRQLDRMGISDISAPGADELDDEFPYTPKSQREVERVLGKAYSRISKTAEQIRLEVVDEVNGLNASINLTATQIRNEVNDIKNGLESSISQTANSILLEVESVENAVSGLELDLDGITQRVQNAEGNIGQLELTATSLSGRISDAEGGIAALEVSLDGISLEFSKTYLTKNDAASIYQTENQVRSLIEASENGIALEFSKTYLTKDDAEKTYQTESQVKSAISISENGIKQTVSETYLTKESASGIYATQSDLEKAEDRVYSSIDQTADSITSTVSATYAKQSELDKVEDNLYRDIDDMNESISTMTQTANKINWLVKSGTSASDFTMTDRAISLVANSIDLTGYVTFSSLTESGKTSINGANIQTGTITASKIDASELKVDAANITGTLAIGKLPDTVAQKGDIPTKLSAFTNDSEFQNASGVTTIIDGRVTADYIEALGISVNAANITGKLVANQIDASDLTVSAANITGVLTAGTIKGNVIQMLTEDGYLAADMTLTASSSSLTGGSALNIRSGAVAIYSEVGDVFIKSYNQAQNDNFSSLDLTAVRGVGGVIYTRGHLIPSNDKAFDIGYPTMVYKTAYIANGVVSLSDRREKRDIDYDLTLYDALFDNLAPCSFRFVDGDRVHIGMISQDVEERMAQCGIDSMELAAFIKSPNEDGGYRYGLRYSEFISLLIDQVQKLKRRVKDLEEAA